MNSQLDRYGQGCENFVLVASGAHGFKRHQQTLTFAIIGYFGPQAVNSSPSTWRWGDGSK
jgi:hypothetical protein